MDELKPYNLCQSHSTLVKINQFRGHRVECMRCHLSTSYYDTEEQAIKAWNTRKEEPSHEEGGKMSKYTEIKEDYGIAKDFMENPENCHFVSEGDIRNSNRLETLIDIIEKYRAFIIRSRPYCDFHLVGYDDLEQEYIDILKLTEE